MIARVKCSLKYSPIPGTKEVFYTIPEIGVSGRAKSLKFARELLRSYNDRTDERWKLKSNRRGTRYEQKRKESKMYNP